MFGFTQERMEETLTRMAGWRIGICPDRASFADMRCRSALMRVLA